MNDAAASTPEEIAQTTRYTSYTVFRRLSGLTEDGELTTAQVAEALTETVPLIESASDGGVEIPLIIDDSNSPLPTLDSTRLLARAAIRRAVGGAHEK